MRKIEMINEIKPSLVIPDDIENFIKLPQEIGESLIELLIWKNFFEKKLEKLGYKKLDHQLKEKIIDLFCGSLE